MVQLGHKDPLGPKVLLEEMEVKDHQGCQEGKANLDYLVNLAKRDRKEKLEKKEKKVTLDYLEDLVVLDLED